MEMPFPYLGEVLELDRHWIIYIKLSLFSISLSFFEYFLVFGFGGKMARTLLSCIIIYKLLLYIKYRHIWKLCACGTSIKSLYCVSSGTL